jgi:hypothetical protein
MDSRLANLPDDGHLAFVIRLWLEEVSADRRAVVWRGQIRHALTGEARYFQEMNEMNAFIERYIQEMASEL